MLLSGRSYGAQWSNSLPLRGFSEREKKFNNNCFFLSGNVLFHHRFFRCSLEYNSILFVLTFLWVSKDMTYIQLINATAFKITKETFYRLPHSTAELRSQISKQADTCFSYEIL